MSQLGKLRPTGARPQAGEWQMVGSGEEGGSRWPRAAKDTQVGTAAGPWGTPQPQAGPKHTDHRPSGSPRQRGERGTERRRQGSSGTPRRSPRCLWSGLAGLGSEPALPTGALSGPKIQNPLPEPLQINCHTQSWGILYKGHRTKSSRHARLAAALQWPQGPRPWSEPGTRELKSRCGVFSERGRRLRLHACPEQPQVPAGTLRGRRCSDDLPAAERAP